MAAVGGAAGDALGGATDAVGDGSSAADEAEHPLITSTRRADATTAVRLEPTLLVPMVAS